MVRRIFLMSLTVVLIVSTITFLAAALGLGRYLPGNYVGLFVMATIVGFGGAFFSLAASRWMAKTMMGVQVIAPSSSEPRLRQLVERVHRLARAAGLETMPEVGVWHGAEMNAFATGPSRNRSLVAVSSALLQHMDDSELDGVLAHEIAHISNGDMVTMTLLQGVINTFVFFLAHILATAATAFLSGRGQDDDRRSFGGGFAYYGILMLMELVLGLLGMLVVSAFSRFREFRADAGGASLAGRQKMIAALRALQQNMRLPSQKPAESFASMQIFGRNEGFRALFATHPPLEKRIAALQAASIP
ncbi:MAG: protease HtpX [Leptospirales bacterium]|nr:protease HtpX [Leptospirales bacterium]